MCPGEPDGTPALVTLFAVVEGRQSSKASGHQVLGSWVQRTCHTRVPVTTSESTNRSNEGRVIVVT